MNLLNIAVGGLAGGLSDSALAPLTGAPIAQLLSGQSSVGNPSAPAAAVPVPARDSVISELPDISSSVNLLQQAAGAQTTGDSDDLSLPALAPMPAPQKPPDVPTDDHGQSNVVFSDSSADGALIH